MEQYVEAVVQNTKSLMYPTCVCGQQNRSVDSSTTIRSVVSSKTTSTQTEFNIFTDTSTQTTQPAVKVYSTVYEDNCLSTMQRANLLPELSAEEVYTLLNEYADS